MNESLAAEAFGHVEAIFPPSADNDEYLSVNRATGNAVVFQKWKGVCRKEGKRSTPGSQAF